MQTRLSFAARFALSLLCTAPVGAALGAQGWIIPRPCVSWTPMTERPGVTVPIRDCATNIARTRSDVHVELTDRVLHYEVEERFVNRGAGLGEADYIFPLPANAAFQDLKLSINGELVSGETMNAADARRIYENIVRTQRDPALVEWMGRGLVRARIFPLNPGEEKRVVIRFQSVAPREGDALRIDYFRAAGVSSSNVHDDGSRSFTLTYSPGAGLGNAYSPTHSLDVSDRGGRREVSVRGDARDVTLLVPVRRTDASSVGMLPYAPGGEDGFALFTVTPPAVSATESSPRDITLVLDVSGSMSGRKIEQARAAGVQLLSTLRPSDRFRLIDFSSDVHNFRDEFVSATAENVRAARRYLESLEADGGTNIEAALREALRPAVTNGRLPLVLFVTDGEPSVGERSPDRLTAIAVEANAHAATPRRIFTFGLGSDVNVSLLEQLALEGRGTSQFVRPDESVERMVGVVAHRLVDPVLTDVRVRVDGDVQLAKMLPTQPADVFADADLVLLARYSGHGSARVVVEGNRRGAPVRWTSTVDFPERDRSSPYVARLWATQRVGFLSAERHRNGASPELDDEIKSLGERYGIPTEFTSYLVTEPRFAANIGVMRGALNGAAGSPAAAAAPAPVQLRDLRFEAAKAAAEQRAVTTTVALDSMLARGSGGANGAAMRHVGSRAFALRDGVWTDVRYQPGMKKLIIKPFSRAYFDILDAIPELRNAFALGTRVAIAGKSQAIVLADDGATELSSQALAAIAKEW
ncbi:MAG TPA: VIT domain-containing protein [Gemmatimonadaceae bacterium]|nr:VIT domain-containing protein [Gemmatimonadaceae bacterium]